MNLYRELIKKQMEEFNKFPIVFAFSDEQFIEGLKELGLSEKDTDMITGIGNGGYIKKTDVKKYIKLHKRFKKEIKKAIHKDKTGEIFVKDMFEEELANHEYGYTMGLDETLEALGITIEEINNSNKLKNGLKLALAKYEKMEED